VRGEFSQRQPFERLTSLMLYACLFPPNSCEGRKLMRSIPGHWRRGSGSCHCKAIGCTKRNKYRAHREEQCGWDGNKLPELRSLSSSKILYTYTKFSLGNSCRLVLWRHVTKNNPLHPWSPADVHPLPKI
jgi:hypothetical protein